MNTVVIFACSLGMDMKFNVSHHQHTEVKSAHSHSDAKKHHHTKQEKDNCCKDEAVKFAKADKLSPQTSHAEINPVFFPALLANIFNLNILDAGSNVFTNKFFVLGHHPPIPDIRIAIQSFQI